MRISTPCLLSPLKVRRWSPHVSSLDKEEHLNIVNNLLARLWGREDISAVERWMVVYK